MGDIDVDFFLTTIEQLITSSDDVESILNEKHQLESLKEEIEYMRAFLKVTEKSRNEHSNVKNLVMQIKDVVSEAENIVEHFLAFESHAQDQGRLKSIAHAQDHGCLKSTVQDQGRLKSTHAHAQDQGRLKSTHARYEGWLKSTHAHAQDQSRLKSAQAQDQGRLKGKPSKDQGGLKGKPSKPLSLDNTLNQGKPKRNIFVKRAIVKAMFPALQEPEPFRFVNQCTPTELQATPQSPPQPHADSSPTTHPLLDLKNVREKIKTLTVDLKQIYDENRRDIKGGEELEHSFPDGEGASSSSGGNNTSKGAEEKVVIGFKGEIDKILGNLCNSGNGSLEIISIVGAPGGGKTTLAREVYNHPLTIHTFEIRAWINVSGDYDKTKRRNLFIPILESSSRKEHGDYDKSTCEDKLGEKTHIYLKGKKYLIVMDDIWDIQAWADIQRSLPKECNGSKVLFTSRQPIKPDGMTGVLHPLAPLSKSFSWDLLREKVFGKGPCPRELVGIGEEIAEKCRGLPLAIVAIAGMLAVGDKTLNTWKKVFRNLGEIIAKTQDPYMKILELSYNHLPLHLKACFAYIGGFSEDSEIPVRELIWLWIAEGFILQNEGGKSLEEKAKDYLSSLVDRNLIIVARRRCSGGIKACRIHDLLRELCLKKAKEDNFLVQIYKDYTCSSFAATKHRRLFIGRQFLNEFRSNPCTQNLRSFLCPGLQDFDDSPSLETDMSLFAKSFEFLRVLALKFGYWRHGITERGHLFHLRYLAIQLAEDTSDFESSLSYLFNLETLNVKSWAGVTDIPLPHDIFKMVKLRHLHSKNRRFTYHHTSLKTAGLTVVDYSSNLNNLQTLHSICSCDECHKILVRAPNLRKLGFIGALISEDSNVLMLPDLEFLKCLETLSFKQQPSLVYLGGSEPTILMRSPKFPPSVTQLTLSDTFLKWEELSILVQSLPKLEVLKLLWEACRGQIWNVSDTEEGFSQLKYLRLEWMPFQEWNASEDQFPRLEVLVVKGCHNLERIPTEFGNLNELREIQVIDSSSSAEESAREIQEGRSATGGDGCMKLLATSNHSSWNSDEE